MKKEMLELLEKEMNLKGKNAEEIFQIGVKEIGESVKKLGLKDNDFIKRSELQNTLETEYIGQEMYTFEAVRSTNSVAKFLAETGVSEGTIIISETQTGGKGRSGKEWVSPKGGIWLSIILNPEISPAKAPLLTLATGVAVRKTLTNFGIESEIKWTNDILINDKKVCGILTESLAKQNQIEHVIIGIGINADLNIESLPEKFREGSVSLSEVVDEKINKIKGLTAFCKEFEFIYNKFKEEDFEYILKEWRKYSHTIGKHVKIYQAFGKIIAGYAVGIDYDGALILEKANGKLVRVISGECRVQQ